MNGKAIAYILSGFPSQTETFILKEALHVSESMPLYIIALKKGKCRTDDRINAAFGNRLLYIPQWWSWKVLLHALLNVNVLYRELLFTGFRNSLHRIKVLLTAFFVSKKIEKLPVRHLHAHFANYPADVAMALSRLSGIPFSFTAHARDIYVNPLDLPGKIRNAAFVTTCTEYNKKWLDAMATPAEHGKIHLVYHGVDVHCWPFRHPEPEEKPAHILAVGRLVEKKGMIYLLEAVSLLLKRGVSIQLHIVGRGVEERRLKHFCRKFGMEQTVVFTGWQTPAQIRDLYLHSDVFVLPSMVASNGDRDGIPNVLLEAMSVGVPVVSTPVSGIPEVIRNGFNGLLVPERDSVTLANAVLQLLGDMPLRNMLVENARRTVREKFDSNQCNSLLIQLFEDALRIASAPVSTD